MTTTSYTSWDFHNYHIQQDVRGGQFVSAASTLIGAGPPRLSFPAAPQGQPATIATTSNVSVYPIGLLESVGLQQNRQLQQIFEVGSSRSYFIPGRTIGALSVGRTFYYGPSLLKVLYAYYKQAATATIPVGSKASTTVLTVDGQSMPDPQAALLDGADPASLHVLQRSPGQDHFYIDLASDLFAQPTGLAIYFKDQNTTTVGAFYLEDAYVQGHQMSISSGSVMIMEGVSMMYDKIAPIKMI
jgi:hypothetical protein